MRRECTVYDSATGKVLATGYANETWQSADPGRSILWGEAASDDQRVDPATGALITKPEALGVTSYSLTAGMSLSLTLPVEFEVWSGAELLGSLNPGGDTLAFPVAGTFLLDLVDSEAGVWRRQRITVTVT